MKCATPAPKLVDVDEVAIATLPRVPARPRSSRPRVRDHERALAASTVSGLDSIIACPNHAELLSRWLIHDVDRHRRPDSPGLRTKPAPSTTWTGPERSLSARSLGAGGLHGMGSCSRRSSRAIRSSVDRTVSLPDSLHAGVALRSVRRPLSSIRSTRPTSVKYAHGNPKRVDLKGGLHSAEGLLASFFMCTQPPSRPPNLRHPSQDFLRKHLADGRFSTETEDHLQ